MRKYGKRFDTNYVLDYNGFANVGRRIANNNPLITILMITQDTIDALRAVYGIPETATDDEVIKWAIDNGLIEV